MYITNDDDDDNDEKVCIIPFHINITHYTYVHLPLFFSFILSYFLNKIEHYKYTIYVNNNKTK